MMARWLCTVMVSAVAFGSGCCCMSRGTCCDPCGPPTCCFSFPCLQCFHPITWDGCCNDCGPSPCEPCGNYCGGCRDGLLSHCFLFNGIRGCWTCNRGCGEIYCDEWKSDPPDCCDPCDQCCGEFTGPHGYCCLGPFQRLLACLDGYKYCPPPNCGPWRPIFGHCNPCGPVGGCGDVGCSTCGGGGPPHGADIYYEGPVGPQGAPVPTTRGTTTPAPRATPAPQNVPSRTMPPARSESTGVIDEVWSVPRTSPQMGKPIQSSQQPSRNQFGGRNPQNAPQQMTAAQVAAKRAAQTRAEALSAAGVKSASYQR